MNVKSQGLKLFLATAILSISTGLWLQTTDALEVYPVLIIYPLLCGIFGFFVYSYLGTSKKVYFELRNNLALLGVILVPTIWLCSVEPYMFKIVHDEGLIASVAQSFHLERAASVSKIANWSTGVYQTFEGYLDKRTLLLPFLVSIIHDISGYRIANVFFLNSLFLFGLLLLISTHLREIGDKSAAFLALILLAFLPVLAQGATSGNASILNALLLMGAFVLGMRYWKEPNETTLPPLVYCLILLANARYESILYILPFGILILLGWKKAERIILTPLVIIAPLFLIFNAWHLRYAMTYEAFYIQDGPDGRDASFSLAYVITNFRETIKFLFSFGSAYTNSPLLSICGVSGIAVLIFHSLKGSLLTNLKAATLLLVTLLVTNFAVVLCFNFGLFTSYVTGRLSLPLNTMLCLFAAYGFLQDKRLLFRIAVIATALALVGDISFGGQPLNETSALRFVIGIIVLIATYALLASHANRLKVLLPTALLLLSIAVIAPKMRSHPYLDAYPGATAMGELLNFVEENNSKDTLFVTWFSYYPILKLANSLPPNMMPEVEQLKLAVQSDHYKRIYYLAFLTPDRSNLPEFPVPDGFELIPVTKERLAPGYFFAASELRLVEDETTAAAAESEAVESEHEAAPE
jgi:hypothetical protein